MNRFLLKTICLVGYFAVGLALMGQTKIHENKTLQNYDPGKFSYKYVANTEASEVKLPGCKPVHIWMLMVQGPQWPTGYPELLSDVMGLTIEDMFKTLLKMRDNILDNHKHGKGMLSEQELENLRKWKLDLNFDYTVDELHDIGRRLKTRFPGLFNRPFKAEDYTIGGMDTKQHMYKQFAKSIWGPAERYINYSIGIDPSSRFREKCFDLPYWKPLIRSVYRRLNETVPDLTKTIREISQRLGFSNNISLDMVSVMYVMCMNDKALFFNQPSPWCSAFSDDNLFTMYARVDNLRLQYSHEFNIQALALFFDAFDKFKSIITGAAKKTYGTFYISSPSRAIADVFAHNYHNSDFWKYDQQQHEFYLAGIYGRNYAFVLNECEPHNYKVQLFINEKLVEIPHCAEAAACKYSQFVLNMELLAKYFMVPCGREIHLISHCHYMPFADYCRSI